MRKLVLFITVLSLTFITTTANACNEKGLINCFLSSCKWDRTQSLCQEYPDIPLKSSGVSDLVCSQIKSQNSCNELLSCYWSGTGMELGTCFQKQKCEEIRASTDCEKVQSCYWTTTGMMGGCIKKDCEDLVHLQLDCEKNNSCYWATTGMMGGCARKKCENTEYNECVANQYCYWATTGMRGACLNKK